ncbi:uncharacterized protein LOC141632026 [Silene latifolia]|uniref:uncharacterized protein LOC141632026 n=1 Tax=Silene latifolia TaxID=37657 RepID=UPI003D77589A
MPLPMEMVAPESYADSPFTDDIATVAFPKGFSVPTITLFDGTIDPCDHISQFKQKMMVTTATGASKEACMCKGFGSTLTGAALQWFVGLPNGTISSFADLVNAFNQQFSSSRRTPKQPSDLYRIVQEIGESIKDYVTRFNAEKVSIRGCDMSTAINAFRQGLDKESNLYKELTMYPCERFEEVQQRATAALRLEEDIQARKGIANFDKTSRKFAPEKKDDRAKPYSRPNVSRIAEKTQQIDDSPHPPKLSEYGFNTGMEGLLKALRNLGDQDRREAANQVLPSAPPICTKIINVITGGSELAGLTYSAAKRKATGSKGGHPETSYRVSQSNLPPVTFDETDMESGAEQHDDALTITLSIGNCTVRKALVDTASSVNLIMLETLKTMGFDKENLIKKFVPLVGFSGETAHSVGDITIPTYIEGVNKLVRHLVIEGPTTYNVILGRPWLHQMKAVPSTYHQCLKFPTPWGTVTLKGDQEESRNSYTQALKATTKLPSKQLQDRGTSTEYKEPPSEELDQIHLDEEHPDRTVLIGATCSKELRNRLIQFLKNNMDCFAWSHNDMVGIDPSVISHKLSVNPSCTPVQQKRRKFAAKRNEVINEEVDSLLAADKIREVSYPEWLSNVVVVPKKNGKWMKPKDVQRLAGKVAALNRFISRASDRCKLFYDILRKSQKFEWTEEHEKAFAELKRYLSTPPLLAKPEQGEPLFLYLSVTEAAVSAVLVKEQEGVQHPVYYISKSQLPAETRYTSFEKLALALVTASYKLRPYFESHTIHVITNYPLKTIMRKPELSGRMTKWSVHLSGYDLQFESRTAIKSQALADFVSDFCPVTRREAEEGMLAITGNQDGEIWTLYIDGASNARGAGVGLVLRSPKGDMIVQAIRCEFKATNNEAEYEALILGIQMASGLKGEPDQKPTKEDVHMQCAQGARTLVSAVGLQDADWRVPYLNWLRDGTLPEDRKEAQSFRIKASRYIMIDNILFRKSLAGPCLKCLGKEEAETVLKDVHSGECRNHAGGQSLSNKILRQGYFWPTMRADAVNHAKRCESCQKAAPGIHQPAEPMHPIISPWPFMMWGMDIVGKLPRAPGNRVYMLAMTNYFSKWIEAEAMTKVKEQHVISFIKRNIISRFGIPSEIICDNGSQFISDNTEGFCARWNITLRKSAPRYPQTNGQAESSNKIIVENLRKRLEELGGK